MTKANSGNVETTKTEVNVRISKGEEEVFVHFGELVAWISMSPVRAIEIADIMKDMAEEVLRSDA